MTGWCAPFGIQLVSVTNQFKFEAPDGKLRGSDALDAECVSPKMRIFGPWNTFPNNDTTRLRRS